MLSNFKVGTRMYGGFAAILVPMALLAAFVMYTMSSTSDDVVEYRATAVNTNQIGRIQANVLMTRLGMKDFLKTGSEESVGLVRERLAASLALFDEATATVSNDEEAAALAGMRAKMTEYGTTFDQIVVMQGQRNEVVGGLDTLGPELAIVSQALLEEMAQAGNLEGTKTAARILEDVEMMRLYASKYLLNNEDAAMQEAQQFKARTIEEIETLEVIAVSGQFATLKEGVNRYGEGMDKVREIITARNGLVTGTLDRIGPEVAASVEELKLAYKATQDRLGPAMQARSENAILVTEAVALAALVLGIAVAWLISRSIVRPVTRLTGVMGEVSDGKLETEIPSVDAGDEIGDMARAVEVFRDNMVKARDLEAQERAAMAERERRAKKMEETVNRFRLAIADRIRAMKGVSGELDEAAVQLAGVAQQTKSQSTDAAGISMQTASNVQSISAAIEEMNASFTEIAEQVLKASQSVQVTSGQAKSAQAAMADLQEQSNSIAEVVSLISDISEQTNLLALNATIEAARAGDAGKGFAVVASEVKNLANSTNKATEEISKKILQVQQNCAESVQAVQSIVESISSVDDISTMISAAVEEQKSVAAEIARNMSEAAEGTDRLSGNIAQVDEASDRTVTTVERMTQVAKAANDETGGISTEIDTFIRDVEAA
ncbi:MAG: methyl-accepting chemotaxis protein [Minwuia sp.]|uniref:methyl-accepting chemotaxis protein n=1 Tax=Minwuia sp. TaxID=2493630 RepID=UPI003A84D3EE